MMLGAQFEYAIASYRNYAIVFSVQHEQSLLSIV